MKKIYLKYILKVAAIINRTQDRFNSSNLIFISTFIFRERAPRLPYYNSAAAAAAAAPRPYGVSNRPFRGYFLRLQTEGNLLLLLIAKGGERMIHPLTPPLFWLATGDFGFPSSFSLSESSELRTQMLRNKCR